MLCTADTSGKTLGSEIKIIIIIKVDLLPGALFHRGPPGKTLYVSSIQSFLTLNVEEETEAAAETSQQIFP